jgi:hypothetical protein
VASLGHTLISGYPSTGGWVPCLPACGAAERPQPAASAGGPVRARLSSKKPVSASNTRTASQARNAASPVGAGEKTGPDRPVGDPSRTIAGLSGCGPHALLAASSESDSAPSHASSSAAAANSPGQPGPSWSAEEPLAPQLVQRADVVFPGVRAQ